MRIFGFLIERQPRIPVYSRRELTEKVEELITRMNRVDINRKTLQARNSQEAAAQDEITAILAQSDSKFFPKG